MTRSVVTAPEALTASLSMAITFEPTVFNTEGLLTLLNEDGHDLATQYMEKYADERRKVENIYGADALAQGRAYVEATKGQPDRSFQSAEAFAEYKLEESVGMTFYSAYLGKPQGQHSGEQDCVMRYYFAEFYPMNGKDDTYYQVTPGTERIGIDICHAGTGTGINDFDRDPQSRYGDAATGEGDCFSQICPNDAIAPRSSNQ
jgi:hypothetical protein